MGTRQMKLFEIKSWYSGKVLFSLKTTSLKLCVMAAVKGGAVLSDADLRGAVLRGAVLSGAVLSDADLRGAVFDIAPVTDEQAVKNLDTVREIILDKQERLHMSDWHLNNEWQKRTCLEEAECGTGHCLAGWLQVCSTDENIRRLPAATAGILLAPIASHMFYKTNDEVLSWLDKREYALAKGV